MSLVTADGVLYMVAVLIFIFVGVCDFSLWPNFKQNLWILAWNYEYFVSHTGGKYTAKIGILSGSL